MPDVTVQVAEIPLNAVATSVPSHVSRDFVSRGFAEDLRLSLKLSNLNDDPFLGCLDDKAKDAVWASLKNLITDHFKVEALPRRGQSLSSQIVTESNFFKVCRHHEVHVFCFVGSFSLEESQLKISKVKFLIQVLRGIKTFARKYQQKTKKPLQGFARKYQQKKAKKTFARISTIVRRSRSPQSAATT